MCPEKKKTKHFASSKGHNRRKYERCDFNTMSNVQLHEKGVTGSSRIGAGIIPISISYVRH